MRCAYSPIKRAVSRQYCAWVIRKESQVIEKSSLVIQPKGLVKEAEFKMKWILHEVAKAGLKAKSMAG